MAFVKIEGVVKNIQCRTAASGRAFHTFDVWHHRPTRGGGCATDVFPVSSFGDTGKDVKTFSDGDAVVLVCDLSTREWNGKNYLQLVLRHVEAREAAAHVNAAGTAAVDEDAHPPASQPDELPF